MRKDIPAETAHLPVIPQATNPPRHAAISALVAEGLAVVAVAVVATVEVVAEAVVAGHVPVDPAAVVVTVVVVAVIPVVACLGKAIRRAAVTNQRFGRFALQHGV